MKNLVLSQKRLSVIVDGKVNIVPEESKEENVPGDQEKAEKHSKFPQGEEWGLWTPELSTEPKDQLSLHP